ncbi:MAG: 4'-phosphopantetheinyl transferase superfamily protein [Leptolyngbya sp.]|nr:4'-phosphopantetheinyl transferase superfamily protein [Leptolyngbya sp.]
MPKFDQGPILIPTEEGGLSCLRRFHGDRLFPLDLAPAAQVWQVADSVVMAVPLAAVTPDPQLLSPAEQTQADRIHHDQRRQTFLASRTLMRQWLSQVTGESANRLTLGTGPHGKPFLVENPSLQFNLSHGGDWLAIVLREGGAVGIDIEPIQPRQRLAQLCRRYLSEGESLTLLSLPLDRAQVQFLRYWTCKEAYVKGLGVGLTIPLNTVDLTLSADLHPANPKLLQAAQGLESGWQIYQWQPTAGYVAALALKRHDQDGG